MPKVKRMVDQELGHAELNTELRDHAKTVRKDGVFLTDNDQNTPVEDGDFLVPKPALFSSPQGVADDTNVYVVKVVPEAGIFYGSYHNKEGVIAYQFFNGDGFTSKFKAGGKPSRKRA
jgi:hypothetical protein